MRGTRGSILSTVLLVLAAVPLHSESRAGSWLDELSEKFTDPKDGAFDASNWLSGGRGFLPIPIIITDPTLGAGGGAALAFFHDDLEEEPISDEVGEPDRQPPPTMSMVAAAGTGNGSWLAGAGHFGVWCEDRLRYLGVAGYGSVNLDFFGEGAGTTANSQGYNVEGVFLLQELKARIGETDFFVGPRYSLIAGDVGFDGFPAVGTTQSALGFVANYDNVDNVLTPNRGIDAGLRSMFFAQGLGGDDDYQKFHAYAKAYHPVHERLVLGLRLDGKFSADDPPFWELPSLDLRGVRLMRYQDEQAVLGEVEARWNVWKRLSLVGFVGWGGTLSSSFDMTESVVAGGPGIRYLLARKLGLQVGIDVGIGPEEEIVYIQVGHAWAR